MAQRTITTDDFSDSVDATHLGVVLEFEDRKVSLDLGDENYAELLELLQPYFEAGSPVKRRKDSAQIREWAQGQEGLRDLLHSNGRGRLPAEVVQAYGAAHSS